jgi:cell division protein FtsL
MAAAPARRAPARRAPARSPTRTRPAKPAPARRTAPARRPAPTKPSTTARVKARPHGAAVLDRLLHGRGWIALVFLLLVGIVFFNVDLLRMNRDIAATADRAGEVKGANARLRTELARLGSSERIQRVAADAGLVMPAPGEVRYLSSSPTVDARRAAKRIDKGEVAGPPAAPLVPPEPVEPEPTVIDPAAGAPVEPVVPAPVEPAPVAQTVTPEPVTPEPVAAAPVGTGE